MSYAHDPIHDEWRFEETSSRCIDRCPHGVPDDCPCVDCDEEDARVENEVIATMGIYHSLFVKAGVL